MEHHEPQDNKAHEEEKNCNKEDTMLQSKEAKKPSLFRRSSINSGRPNFSDIAEFQRDTDKFLMIQTHLKRFTLINQMETQTRYLKYDFTGEDQRQNLFHQCLICILLQKYKTSSVLSFLLDFLLAK